MKKLIVIIMSLVSVELFAQHVPIAEPVNGGYIEEVDAIPITSDTTRVFIATRAANALFYTDVCDSSGTPVFSSYHVVPDYNVSANTNYIHYLAVDESSHYAFTAFEFRALWATDITAGSAYCVDREPVDAVEAYYGHLFYLKKVGADEIMYFAPISSSGTVGTIDFTTLQLHPTWAPRFKIRIMVHPINKHVYVFIPGDPPFIYKSSDTYDSFTPHTTFSLISTTDLTSSGHDFVAMGIAPDGRIFAASYEGNTDSYNAWMAYTDFDGDPWTISSVSQDMGRGDFSIVGTPSSYYVYYSRVASYDKGTTWQWASDKADGDIAGDPNNPAYAYTRTDWGMGIYSYATNSTTETNDGIQAVQVKALGMNKGKSKAYVASKAGVWYVNNYNTASPIWSSPIWPDGDSYPYTSAICDTSGDRAYVGNTGGKLYRYDASSGPADDPSNWTLIFDAEGGSPFPHWTWTYGTRISSIAIDHSSATERIFIGLYDEEDWDEHTEHYGAVFVGENSGGSWSWYQITSSVIPDGIDVNDLTAVTEHGHTVLYVGVDRNTSYSPTVNGVYRMDETSPGSWTVTQDLYLAGYYPISATIVDIAKSPQDTLYACGTDGGVYNPTIYKKAIGDTCWTVVPSTGFGATGNIARSITFDNSGDIYVAVNNYIFEHTPSASSWTVYYRYPTGTEINFIYYDDLLVGTGTGLYVHHTEPSAVKEIKNNLPNNFTLYQNYPNPFNPTTTIKYSVPSVIASGAKQSFGLLVRLKVYDILGREVAELVNKYQTAGNYKVNFNAVNFTSGIYFYRLRVGNFVQTKKMILIK